MIESNYHIIKTVDLEERFKTYYREVDGDVQEMKARYSVDGTLALIELPKKLELTKSIRSYDSVNEKDLLMNELNTPAWNIDEDSDGQISQTEFKWYNPLTWF